MKGEVTAVFLNRVLLLWDRATPQEHVWRATREAVSHNHTHSHLTDLADAFETSLRTTKFPGSLLSKHAYHEIAVRSK